MNQVQIRIKQIMQKAWELCEKLFSSAKTNIKKCLAETKEKEDSAEDEETLFAKAFQECLSALASEVYGVHKPYLIAQRVLKFACEFYDADWCGMFDADMMLDLWMPFWWYNRQTDGMTQTQLQEGRVMGSFEMFRNMITDNTPYYQPDIESIQLERPEEYALFKSQDVKSFLSVPYSRREQGIIFLRNPKHFADRPEMLRIISNILIQEINEQKHRDRLRINAASAEIRKDADVIINLFGGIEIITEQGKLVEAEMKSATCNRIFVLLMLHRHRGMTAKELSNHIWADKDFDNPTGNLRSMLYRLRSMFELLSDADLVVTTKNGYRINPDLKIHTDFEHFESLCNSITPFLSIRKKIELLQEAVTIYDGELFPNGNGEHWLMVHSTKYHMMYLKAVEQLLSLLNEVEDYQTLHDYAMLAMRLEPNNIRINYWLVIALRKNGAVELARQQLDAARARLFEEEFRELEHLLNIA